GPQRAASARTPRAGGRACRTGPGAWAPPLTHLAAHLARETPELRQESAGRVGEPVVDVRLAPGDEGLELLVDRGEGQAAKPCQQGAVGRLRGGPRLACGERHEHAEAAVLEEVAELVAVLPRARDPEPRLGAEREDQDDIEAHEQPAPADV